MLLLKSQVLFSSGFPLRPLERVTPAWRLIGHVSASCTRPEREHEPLLKLEALTLGSDIFYYHSDGRTHDAICPPCRCSQR